MKLVFICSPFRASTDWQRAENVRRAERMALDVWNVGACAICPQANSALFHGEGPDDRYLAGYLELLSRCDAVYAGARSDGVDAEIARATNLGIPVFRSAGEVAAWLAHAEAPLFHP